jgi:hypothetical protein
LASLVNLIPLTYYVNPYAPIFINIELIYLPIGFLILILFYVDLIKWGDHIREIFIGFSLWSFTLGINPFIQVIVYQNWDFTRYSNMYLLFRSIYLSGIFALYERVIWLIQNRHSLRNPKPSC